MNLLVKLCVQIESTKFQQSNEIFTYDHFFMEISFTRVMSIQLLVEVNTKRCIMNLFNNRVV